MLQLTKAEISDFESKLVDEINDSRSFTLQSRGWICCAIQERERERTEDGKREESQGSTGLHSVPRKEIWKPG